MSDELKERNILKMILIVRFACATLDVGHPIKRMIAPGISDVIEFLSLPTRTERIHQFAMVRIRS
jgi:hypothetical protein